MFLGRPGWQETQTVEKKLFFHDKGCMVWCKEGWCGFKINHRMFLC